MTCPGCGGDVIWLWASCSFDHQRNVETVEKDVIYELEG